MEPTYVLLTHFFLSVLAGTAARYVTPRDTFTKLKSKQNNSSKT